MEDDPQYHRLHQTTLRFSSFPQTENQRDTISLECHQNEYDVTQFPQFVREVVNEDQERT